MARDACSALSGLNEQQRKPCNHPDAPLHVCQCPLLLPLASKSFCASCTSARCPLASQLAANSLSTRSWLCCSAGQCCFLLLVDPGQWSSCAGPAGSTRTSSSTTNVHLRAAANSVLAGACVAIASYSVQHGTCVLLRVSQLPLPVRSCPSRRFTNPQVCAHPHLMPKPYMLIQCIGL